MQVRRVVTAANDDGRSYFLIDGPAAVVSDQMGRGLTFHELWVTDGPLASNEGTVDAGARPVAHHPPDGGTLLRIVEFLPDDQQDPGRADADFSAIGGESLRVGNLSDPTMHRNQSVDYNVILSGEIYATTDAGEILLHPGDVLVQRGTAHTWHNRSGAPCVYASVMVSAQPLTRPDWQVGTQTSGLVESEGSRR